MIRQLAALLSLQICIATSAVAQTAAVPSFYPAIVGPKWTPKNSPSIDQAFPVDLNKDGNVEIILFYGSMPNSGFVFPIEILSKQKNTNAYAVATAQYIAGAAPKLITPRTINSGDFNGDGKPDVFIGGHGNDDKPWPGEKDWLLLSSVGGKHVAAIAPPGVAGFTHSSAVADVNRDGLADIYAGMICCGKQKSYMLFGKNGGTPGVKSDAVNSDVLYAYTAAAFADIDIDGWPDLVLGRFNDDVNIKSSIYLNRKGSFGASSPDKTLPDGFFGPTTTVLDILPVDVDSDGYPDLVMSQTGIGYNGYAIQILRNSGNGSFADWTSTHLKNGGGNSKTGGFIKTRIYAADFYGDGVVDLISQGAFMGDMDAIIWINDGSGTFTPYRRPFFADTSKEVVLPSDQNILVPIDVNHDGRSDIVRVGNYNAEEHSVLTYINKGLVGKPAKPVIVRQPKAVTVAAGKVLRLSVAARGRPLSFRWYRNGIAVPGATRPVLTIGNASPKVAGAYVVKVSNSAGSTSSTSVSVKVQ